VLYGLLWRWGGLRSVLGGIGVVRRGRFTFPRRTGNGSNGRRVITKTHCLDCGAWLLQLLMNICMFLGNRLVLVLI
jgi:hypothetical protein